MVRTHLEVAEDLYGSIQGEEGNYPATLRNAMILAFEKALRLDTPDGSKLPLLRHREEELIWGNWYASGPDPADTGDDPPEYPDGVPEDLQRIFPKTIEAIANEYYSEDT